LMVWFISNKAIVILALKRKRTSYSSNSILYPSVVVAYVLVSVVLRCESVVYTPLPN
jgi:hypothetical protein